jgi:hypothetical protein
MEGERERERERERGWTPINISKVKKHNSECLVYYPTTYSTTPNTLL